MNYNRLRGDLVCPITINTFIVLGLPSGYFIMPSGLTFLSLLGTADETYAERTRLLVLY